MLWAGAWIETPERDAVGARDLRDNRTELGIAFVWVGRMIPEHGADHYRNGGDHDRNGTPN